MQASTTTKNKFAPSNSASPVLARLMEEVRNSKTTMSRYDRTHNRHNRGQ
ncbi:MULTISPECIES: YhhA family cyclophane-containing RiPP [unclassified Endozoicomonas]